MLCRIIYQGLIANWCEKKQLVQPTLCASKAILDGPVQRVALIHSRSARFPVWVAVRRYMVRMSKLKRVVLCAGRQGSRVHVPQPDMSHAQVSDD